MVWTMLSRRVLSSAIGLAIRGIGFIVLGGNEVEYMNMGWFIQQIIASLIPKLIAS